MKTSGDNVPASERSLGHLIHLLNQHKDRELNQRTAHLDITAAQFKVIICISKGMVNPVEICRRLSLDGGALTRLLDRLEKKGLLVRVKNAQDRRQVIIQPTPRGDELIAQVPQIVFDTSISMTRNLNDDEISTLKHLIKKIIDSGAE
ncbi:MarR family transcriptional regulator [Budvicia diplopodorum]|uniref:MarR family transcriptional regulator n=1 Tax=Budvicia diplopodorum TaxID=1119056 RepID=UPI00135756CB|nr:MarR family transcriptional regulator [Budvicia diplopodorum]